VLELVIASKNRPKIDEIKEILSGLPVRLITFEELDKWPEVDEAGSSYLENALAKARAFVEVTGKAALADDSGIEVDALDGAPGIRSARLAGLGATDEENNRKLISLLSGVPPEKRAARYRCVAVVSFPDGREIVGTGSCEGRIATEAKGSGGFGYDPWFIPEGESRTMAEISPQEKHAISHRGEALRSLADQLRDLLSADQRRAESE